MHVEVRLQIPEAPLGRRALIPFLGTQPDDEAAIGLLRTAQVLIVGSLIQEVAREVDDLFAKRRAHRTTDQS